MDHKLEACTARFSGAGCPQRPGIGRKHQGPSSSHTTALLLPRDIVHTKDYMKDAFCTAPYLFLFCVFHRDTNPETILNRQEEAGSRQGEEKEKLSAYCGLRSPPTSAFTHSGGGGLRQSLKGLTRTHAFTRSFTSAPREVSTFLLGDDCVPHRTDKVSFICS